MMEVELSKIPSSGTDSNSGDFEEVGYGKFLETGWEGPDYIKFSENDWGGSISFEVNYHEMVMLYGFDIFKLDYPEMETLKSLWKDGLIEQGATYLRMCLQKEGNNA